MRTRIDNRSGKPFRGWVQTTVGEWPTHEAGRSAGIRYVLGRRTGLKGRVVDCYVDVPAGQSVEADLLLGSAEPYQHPYDPALADPMMRLGVPTLAGIPFAMVGGLTADGAAIRAHFRTRVTQMLVADLFVRYYIGQSWAPFMLVLNASNPAVPDLAGVIPPDCILRFGPAKVHVLGLSDGAPVMAYADWLGDGQMRSFPGVINWTANADEPHEPDAAAAFATGSVFAMGGGWESNIGPLGKVPEAPTTYDARPWVAQHLLSAARRLHGWEAGPLGVTASSTVTGAQEDQGYMKGTEAFHGGGPAAARVRYLVALGYGRRPCHHREQNGDRLRDSGHEPRLIFWQNRPHFHTGVSPNQLGKPRQPNSSELHGWWGWDREHWFWPSLGLAYQLTGCPALQMTLEAQAVGFLLGETITAGWSTSSTDAARSAGWTGIIAAWLWLTLEDRALAQRVKDRFRDRVNLIYLPAWGPKNGLLDPRADARLSSEGWTDPTAPSPYPKWWMAYQTALCAGGLQIAGEVLDIQGARELALQAATRVVEVGYDANLVEWDFVGIDGAGTPAPQPYVEGRGTHRTGWFRHAWFPMGVWALLRHYPDHPKARAIWTKIRGEAMAGSKPLDWFPRTA